MSQENQHHSQSDIWISEKMRDFLNLSYRVDKTLFSGQSEFQAVDVIETRGHGKMLFNDGLVMLSERDEFIYHEMITHVPLFTHKNSKRVLIVGGGDGGTAREVLKHKQVQFCKMVEIDKMVVDACIEHIPLTAECLKQNTNRFELKIQDAVEFMKNTDEKYDVILIDSTDPIGPAQPLFGSEFYSNVNRVLNDDGIVVSQGESPFYNVDMQQKMFKVLGEFFPIVTGYNFTNMTYPGGFWTFTFASKKYHPVRDLNKEAIKNTDIEFKYYNENVHKGAFLWPQFMEDHLKGLKKDHYVD